MVVVVVVGWLWWLWGGVNVVVCDRGGGSG